MDEFANPLSNLITRLQKLPGLGSKSAQRIAFYLIAAQEQEVLDLTSAMLQAKESIKRCKICYNYCEGDLCPICASSGRDKSVICVVEDPKDLLAVEKTHEFIGYYHVLHGVISPLDNIGADSLTIKELLHRLADDTVKEVILATNPSVEGEATAMYIARLIKPFGVKVSRLAFGIPVGGNLEYTDNITLAQALDGRREL